MKHIHHSIGISLGVILSVFGVCISATQAASINPLAEARSDVFAVLNVADERVSFRFGDDFVSTLSQRPAVEHIVFTERATVGADISAGELLLALYE